MDNTAALLRDAMADLLRPVVPCLVAEDSLLPLGVYSVWVGENRNLGIARVVLQEDGFLINHFREPYRSALIPYCEPDSAEAVVHRIVELVGEAAL